MENTLHIFNIICEIHGDKSFGFNPDFLEANVINIALLLSGLVYVLKQFLGSSLAIREDKVISAIQESEERLQQANMRLAESEKQLAQTQLIINQIRQEAESTAQKVRESILEQGKLDIERLTAAGKSSIATAENQVRQQIQHQITNLAIGRVKSQLKSKITPSMHARIIDSNIAQLGGSL